MAEMIESPAMPGLVRAKHWAMCEQCHNEIVLNDAPSYNAVAAYLSREGWKKRKGRWLCRECANDRTKN